jgi:copper(I)-binding protein
MITTRRGVSIAISIGVLALMALSLAITLATAELDHGQATPDPHGDHAMATPDSSISTGTGVIYLTITNDGDTDDTLLEATTDRAERVEPHETSVEDDIGRMTPLDGPLAIPAGESVTLEPAGMHLMLVNLTDDIRLGDRFAVTMTFEEAGEVVVPVTVALDADDVESDPVTVGDLTIQGVWSRPAPRIDGASGTPVGTAIATPEADDDHQH